MTAVLSSMDALRKERPMSMDENGLSFLSSTTDWHAKYNEVLDMLSETKAELDEFHSASKELEAELEAELARTEKSQMDLKVKVSKAESERDDWKSKFMSLQTAHNTTTTSLQRELDRLRQEYQLIKVQLRELEMGNDDLERNERAVSSSLADMEAKYSRVLEEKILLEQELLEKVSLEEGSQRLKDELRDATEEISMLRNRLAEASAASEKAVAEALKQYKSSMPPPSITRSPRKAGAGTPPALELADLSPSPTSTKSSKSTSSQISTPKNNTLNKSSLQRSGIYSRESPLSALRTTGFSRSTTTGSLYSPSTSTAARLPARATPVRTSTSSSSFASGSTTSTVSKNKGVQMVSEMRARVRNLEQKIHTRVPRLRMASITGRNSMSSNVSSVPSSSSSVSNRVPSSSSSASNHSTAKTSWESGRPSPDSRKSNESLDRQAKKDSGESGWVLIMEDSPSPVKDKERERRERRRLSNPMAPTSFRNSRAASPSLSTGPTSAYLNMGASPSISASGRRSQSRLSGGNSSTSTVRPPHNSRPTSPTLLPMPTGNYAPKRSTNAPNPLSQSTNRRPLTTSTYGPSSDYRSRSTAHPPLPISDHKKADSKELPTLPSQSTNVTLRASKSTSSGNAVSNLLSKSRIGRPSSGRKSGGGDALDIKDLRPRSGSGSTGFFGN
ncbi:hypothetical protein D9611_003284 [Ephemerocybe angulata]|uniref:NUDE domain-containing protein n=1 Tax=Ephemerocybe angulata TaxID=980116 RepID=A0A8H5CAD6_9AGAR|nr:hypothetical protein D9611_003284 [Tulosesus angulatus]